MKKIIVTLVIGASLISFSSKAQKQNPQQMQTMLKDSLHLTDVQIDSVTAIRNEFTGQIKTIMKDQSLTQDQKKEKVQPLKQAMKERLKAVLSKDQMKKMMEMQHEMHGKKTDDDNTQ